MTTPPPIFGFRSRTDLRSSAFHRRSALPRGKERMDGAGEMRYVGTQERAGETIRPWDTQTLRPD